MGHDHAQMFLDYIKSINNLFSNRNRLQNISTGAEKLQDVVNGLLECLETGEKSYQEFVETKFQNKEKCLCDMFPTNCKTVFIKQHLLHKEQANQWQKKMLQKQSDKLTMLEKEGIVMNGLLKYELTSSLQFLTTECSKDGIHLKMPDKEYRMPVL